MKGVSHMTGSVQRKNNRYHMVISYKDNFGEQKQKWISTGLTIKGNKKAADAMLDKWLKEHAGCDMNAIDQLLSDYLESWMDKAKHHLQPSTVRGYRGMLKNHILPYFKSKKLKLADLHVRHLEDFYAYLQSDDKALSPTSVRHCHRLISCALNDAVRLQFIPVNPASLARLPKQQKYEAKFLNYSQLKELVLLFKGNVLQPVIKLICVYGLRREEALGLCWDMVDFENNRFTICRSKLQGDHGDYLKDSTKNASSYRTLPLTPSMRDVLLALKARREEYAPLFPETYANNNLVFVWDDGTPITSNYVTKTFHKVIEASHLPTIRLHDLRHSSASNLLSQGSTVVEVQHWLGHSQPSTTLNFYSHVDALAKQRISEHIENALVFEDDEEIF